MSKKFGRPIDPSVRRLAAACNISTPHLYGILRRDRGPSLKVAAALSNYLQLSVPYIMDMDKPIYDLYILWKERYYDCKK